MREKVCLCVCWYIMSEFNQKNENKGRRESRKERLLHFSALFEEGRRSKRCRIRKKEDNKMMCDYRERKEERELLSLSVSRREPSLKTSS